MQQWKAGALMMLYLKTYWHVGVILWFLIPTLLKAILIPTNSITFTKRIRLYWHNLVRLALQLQLGETLVWVKAHR